MTKEANIIVHVGRQRDGYVFGLRPRSRVWLEEKYPEKERVASVFFGLDEMRDIQQIPEVLWAQVLHLLNGISPDELNASGGFSVYDPSTKEEISNSLRTHV